MKHRVFALFLALVMIVSLVVPVSAAKRVSLRDAYLRTAATKHVSTMGSSFVYPYAATFDASVVKGGTALLQFKRDHPSPKSDDIFLVEIYDGTVDQMLNGDYDAPLIESREYKMSDFKAPSYSLGMTWKADERYPVGDYVLLCGVMSAAGDLYAQVYYAADLHVVGSQVNATNLKFYLNIDGQFEDCEVGMDVGETAIVLPHVMPLNATTDRTCTATTAQPGVATVTMDAGYLYIRGVAAGSTDIIVRCGKLETRCQVVVGYINGFRAEATRPGLCVGMTDTIKTTVDPPGTRAFFEYTSDRPDVASVSPGGVVTARSPGRASIMIVGAGTHVEYVDYSVQYHNLPADTPVSERTATQPRQAVGRCSVCGREDAANVFEPAIFTDTVWNAWYAEHVDYVYDNGLMNGTGEHSFAPDSTVTRAMVATVLYRMAGQPSVEQASPFSDVAAGQWYADAVAWAQSEGIVTGYPDGTFRPNNNITREQLATILYRYTEDPVPGASLSAFPDAGDVQSYALEGMRWAVASGLINGVASGGRSYIRPGNFATRAQFATIISRYARRGAALTDALEQVRRQLAARKGLAEPGCLVYPFGQNFYAANIRGGTVPLVFRLNGTPPAKDDLFCLAVYEGSSENFLNGSPVELVELRTYNVSQFDSSGAISVSWKADERYDGNSVFCAIAFLVRSDGLVYIQQVWGADMYVYDRWDTPRELSLGYVLDGRLFSIAPYNADPGRLEIGQRVYFAPVLFPGNNNADRKMTVVNQHPEVAQTHIEDGYLVVEARAVGTTRITVTCAGLSTYMDITVGNLRSFTIVAGQTSLCVGNTDRIVTTPDPGSGPIFYDWQSTDPGVVTVRDGVVTAVAPGKAIVTVQCSGITHSVAYEVHYHSLPDGTPVSERTATQPKQSVGRCGVCGREDAVNVFEPAIFTDTVWNAWYAGYVDDVYAKGLMNGTGAHTFSPDSTVTRAMVATVLYRMAGEPKVEKASPFSDVAAGQWYTDAIAWAQSEGIVTGYPDGTYRPNNNITREQLATILYRYTEDPVPGASLSAFPDAGNVQSYAVEAMRWAVASGLINGVAAGGQSYIRPGNYATRVQFATIISRYAQMNEKPAQPRLRLRIGDTPVEVDWEDNDAVRALTAKAEAGPVTVETARYGGFEQVGTVGELPSADERITAAPGDIVLYQGNQMVAFYKENVWSYTRLGAITGKTAEELTALLDTEQTALTLYME